MDRWASVRLTWSNFRHPTSNERVGIHVETFLESTAKITSTISPPFGPTVPGARGSCGLVLISKRNTLQQFERGAYTDRIIT